MRNSSQIIPFREIVRLFASVTFFIGKEYNSVANRGKTRHEILKSIALRSRLSSFFPHHFSGITQNSEQKNISETFGQLIQFSYLLL